MKILLQNIANCFLTVDEDATAGAAKKSFKHENFSSNKT